MQQHFAGLLTCVGLPVACTWFFVLSCQAGSWCPPPSLPALRRTKILPSSSCTRAWRGFTTCSTSTRRAYRSCWNSPFGKAVAVLLVRTWGRSSSFSDVAAFFLNVNVFLCPLAFSPSLPLESTLAKQNSRAVENKADDLGSAALNNQWGF